MWVVGLFQLQRRVLPVLAFALAGRGLGPGKEKLSRIQSKLKESVKNPQEYEKHAHCLNQLKRPRKSHELD